MIKKLKKILFILVFVISIYIIVTVNTDFFLKHTFYYRKENFLFCIILTKKSDINFKAPISYESWIHKCDDYRFLTILPDEANNKSSEFNHKYNLTSTISMDGFNSKVIRFKQKFNYIKLLQPPGFVNDVYNKLTDKVYLAYKYIYRMYPNYKWYLKCDDDTFIYIDSLKRFLNDKNSTRAISYGRLVRADAMEPNKNLLKENLSGFLSGGAGYVLSNEAFGRLARKLESNYSYCPNGGSEDLDVSACLRSLGSVIGVSIDDQARCRFHSNHLFTVYPSQIVTFLYLYF